MEGRILGQKLSDRFEFVLNSLACKKNWNTRSRERQKMASRICGTGLKSQLERKDYSVCSRLSIGIYPHMTCQVRQYWRTFPVQYLSTTSDLDGTSSLRSEARGLCSFELLASTKLLLTAIDFHVVVAVCGSFLFRLQYDPGCLFLFSVSFSPPAHLFVSVQPRRRFYCRVRATWVYFLAPLHYANGLYLAPTPPTLLPLHRFFLRCLFPSFCSIDPVSLYSFTISFLLPVSRS